MAIATDILAGQAFVRIMLDGQQLQTGLRRAQTQVQRFSQNIKTAASQSALLAVSLAAPLALVGKTFADFDDQMRLVSAVSGATGRDFDMLTEKAKKLGRETSFTAAQVAGGMGSLGRMGFAAGEIDQSIAGMMDLARATGTDLPQAAEIAANALRAFGLNTADASRVADILSVTANGSAQTLVDLGEALKSAAPAGRTAGESIQSVNAALMVLANVGLRGSLAGNALKRAYSEIAKPEVQKFLEEYNIKTTDATGNLRRMADVLRDCAVAMNKMGSAQKLNFATKVFGERAAPAALALTVDVGKLDAMVARLNSCEGAAKKAATAMDAGFGGSLRKLSSAAEGVSIAFGEILSTSFTPLITALSKVAEATRNAAKSGGEAVGIVLKLGAALLGIGLAAKAILLTKAALSSLIAPLRALAGLSSAAAVTVPLLTAALAAFVAIAAVAKRRADELESSFARQAETFAKISTAATETRQKGDTERQQAFEAMKRLDELAGMSAKAALSAEQMKEAFELISRLRPFGSAQWAQLDTQAGKVRLLADAHDKLAEALRQEAKSQIRTEIATLQNSIDTKRAEIAAKGQRHFSVADILTGAVDEQEAQIASLSAELDGLQDKLFEAQRRYRNLERGGTAGITGADPAAEEAKAEAAAKERELRAAKELEATRKRLAEIDAGFVSETEKQIQAVQALEDEYEKLMRLKLAALDAERAKKTGDEYKAMTQQRIALLHELYDRKGQFAAQRAGIAADAQKAEAGYTGFLAAFGAEQKSAAAQRMQQDRLAQAIAEGNDSQIRSIMDSLSGKLEGQQKEYTATLGRFTAARSEAGSALSSRERSALTELQQSIRGTAATMQQYQQMIAAGKETAQTRSTAAAVSGAALARMFSGYNTPYTKEEKALKAQEDTAKNTRELTRILKFMETA